MKPAVLLLLSLLLVAPLGAVAQTNVADLTLPTNNPTAETTPAPPATNAPAVAAPVTPSASTDTTPAPPATNAPAAAAPITPSAPVETAPAQSSTNAPPTPFVPDAPPPPLANTQNIAPQAGSAQQEDIDDIRPPYFFPHPLIWILIALAAAALLALVAILWYLFKPHRLLRAKSAYELTLEKLEKARALMQEENPMPYTVLITEAVRSYVAQRFQTPFTRRTTEEFLQQMEADPNTPLAEHRLLLLDFLKRCDLVKFARYQPTLAELDLVYQNALSFVTATKPLPAPRNGNRP